MNWLGPPQTGRITRMTFADRKVDLHEEIVHLTAELEYQRRKAVAAVLDALGEDTRLADDVHIFMRDDDTITKAGVLTALERVQTLNAALS